MKISNFKIRKIIKEEIQRTLFENQSDDNIILELGREAVDILNNLGNIVLETGELDSIYIDLFQEVVEVATESAERNSEDSQGKHDSLVEATEFYSRNINRFPSSLRSSISSLVERFNDLRDSQAPALADAEASDSDESLA